MKVTLEKRTPRSEEDLRLDSKTVWYELKQLIEIAYECSNSENCGVRQCCINAYVESYAIHCRALISFFKGYSGKIKELDASDVLASDYYKEWDFAAKSLKNLDWWEVEAKRANKYVAHITTERRNVNQTGSLKKSEWDILGITNEICNVMKSFLGEVPPKNFDKTALTEMRQLIENWQKRPSCVPSQNESGSGKDCQMMGSTGTQARTQMPPASEIQAVLGSVIDISAMTQMDTVSDNRDVSIQSMVNTSAKTG